MFDKAGAKCYTVFNNKQEKTDGREVPNMEAVSGMQQKILRYI